MKHLVDIDDELLHDAMCTLGTATIKATVEKALAIAINRKTAKQIESLRGLAKIAAQNPDFDRSQAW